MTSTVLALFLLAGTAYLQASKIRGANEESLIQNLFLRK